MITIDVDKAEHITSQLENVYGFAPRKEEVMAVLRSMQKRVDAITDNNKERFRNEMCSVLDSNKMWGDMRVFCTKLIGMYFGERGGQKTAKISDKKEGSYQIAQEAIDELAVYKKKQEQKNRQKTF